MEREFGDRSALFRVLGRLDRGESLGVKTLAAHGGLREVDEHIATGLPGLRDRGRVYFWPEEDGRLVTFVHRKQDNEEQEQFFRRLARGRRASVS